MLRGPMNEVSTTRSARSRHSRAVLRPLATDIKVRSKILQGRRIDQRRQFLMRRDRIGKPREHPSRTTMIQAALMIA